MRRAGVEKLGYFPIPVEMMGWIAAQLRFMDHWWEDHHRWMQPKLDESPSTYFERHFWATFEDDRPVS